MPNRKIILVVEDDHDILELVVAALTSKGCSAFGVTSRDEALAWMQVNGLPETIILDWHMPGMDVPDFMRELLKLGPPPRVVLTTASAYADEKAREVGIPEVLRKPFNPEDLLSQVDHCR